MNEWWTAAQAGIIFGGVLGAGLGVMGGLLGTVMGVFGRAGRFKALVYALHAVGVLVGIGCLAIAAAGMVSRQPWHVWFPPLNVGVVGAAVFGVLWPVSRKLYAQAEQRRLDAALLRGS